MSDTNSNPRLILLGPPGAGKGTQAEKLSEHLDVPHLSAGERLRRAVDEGTEAGQRAEPYIEQGKLVPVEVVVDIMSEAMFFGEGAEGFVVDGFPRNIDQYRELRETLENEGEEIDNVISLEVPEEEIIRRLTGRRICEECGRNYHVDFRPPEEDNKCDVCGGSLYQREDDRPETIQERLDVYREESLPVKSKYREEDLLVEIDASGSIEDVFEDIRSRIDI